MMIDIDKFICSMIEHQMDGSIYKNQLLDSLKQQGIIYKDGSLQRLANSCESSKYSQRIAREEVIEKVCEWLKDFCNEHYIMSYSDSHEIDNSELIETFKKKMEE